MAQPFCFGQKQPVSFEWLQTSIQGGRPIPWVPTRQGNSYNDDFVLDNLYGYPKVADLHAPSTDSDAVDLLNKLRELASRPIGFDSLDNAVLLPTIPSYGVGATVNSLIYPILEALARGEPLAPRPAPTPAPHFDCARRGWRPSDAHAQPVARGISRDAPARRLGW